MASKAERSCVMGENKKARGKVTFMSLENMQYPAWRALSPKAQALYVWLKLEWKGPKFNNNGEISLSVRQAAECMGVTSDTAAKGFRELQAKGFLVLVRPGYLGVEGQGKSPLYEITEIARPPNTSGTCLFRKWKEGSDFEVKKATVSRPLRKTKPCP